MNILSFLLFLCWQAQSHQPVDYFSTSWQPEMETLCTFKQGQGVFGGRHRTEEKTTCV